MTDLSRRQHATRADVARVAGTSVAVVSYVVNNGPRPVSAGTRQRVLDAIEQVGYEPNVIAQALASGVTGAYGLIVPDISNPFFAALAHTLQGTTAESGRVLLLGDSAEDRRRENDLIRSFARRRVDGLLFAGVGNASDLSPLHRNGIPVVVLDRTAGDVHAASVAIDNARAAEDATVHLLGHGYTRIGIIAGPSALVTARDRRDGWQRALDAAGVTANPAWIVEAPFSRAGGRRAGRELLAGRDRPRAVFASNEQQAIGLLATAAEIGVDVPGDLAIVSFDGTESSEYTIPALSGVVQPLAEISRTAVRLIAGEHGDGSSRRPAHVTVDHELRILQSCGSHP